MEGGLTQNSNPSADWDAAVDCYLKSGKLRKANMAAAWAAVDYILQNPLPFS